VRPEQREERGIGRHGGRQHQANGIAGQVCESPGQETRAGEHLPVSHDAGEIVRGGRLAQMGKSLAHEGLENRRREHGERGLGLGARCCPVLRHLDGLTFA
jgi:hypothetical protein